MGEISKIAWTDATFNPWWGCTRVSPGCEHCYAEQLATVRRKLPVWGVDADRKPMSDGYWLAPHRWNIRSRDARNHARAKGLPVPRRTRVFCASMADVFEIVPPRNVAANEVVSNGRARLWKLIAETPELDWLLLTKRPENVRPLAPWRSTSEDILRPAWPDNVWLGVTAEDQRRADERLAVLMKIPARVRFASHEPALEMVDFRPWYTYADGTCRRGLDWIITGGESGSKARPYDIRWALDLLAHRNKGPIWRPYIFVKQLGSNPHDGALRVDPEPDTRIHLKDPKGGDPAEWPRGLAVREHPPEGL